jgi:hypothetical protein
MIEVDVDRIKAQVTAASAARRQEQLLSGIGRLDVLPNEHAAAYLRSHLEKTGLDLQALERAAGPETPPTPLKPGPEAAQAHARRLAQAAKVRRGRAQAAKAAAERHDRALPLLPPPEIVQPVFIVPRPTGILVQDNRAPDDNWAQVEFKSTAEFGVGTVGFFYIWTNPTQDNFGVRVDTLMGFVGSCSVWAKRGALGGHSHLWLGGSLEVYESDVNTVANTTVAETSATSDVWWLDSEYKSMPVDALIDLSYDYLAVSGGGTIVVEAHAYFAYNNDNGEAAFDFAGQFFRISNPNMTFTPYDIIIT